MRIIFMGYQDVGARCLQAIINHQENIVGVFTLPDEVKSNIWTESVKEITLKHKLSLFQPRKINDQNSIDIIKNLQPELIVVVAYNQILSSGIIKIPKYGCINIHGSLLPKYRGRAPINWAIINGETETGVTVHYIIEEVDAGDIIIQKKVKISLEDTAKTILDKFFKIYPEILIEAIELIRRGNPLRISQDPKDATYFPRRYPKDGVIDWTKSSMKIYNLIRGVTHPYPGAFSYINKKKIMIWEAELITNFKKEILHGQISDCVVEKGVVVGTGDGALLLKRMQQIGDDEMNVDDFLEKYNIGTGIRFEKEK